MSSPPSHQSLPYKEEGQGISFIFPVALVLIVVGIIVWFMWHSAPKNPGNFSTQASLTSQVAAAVPVSPPQSPSLTVPADGIGPPAPVDRFTIPSPQVMDAQFAHWQAVPLRALEVYQGCDAALVDLGNGKMGSLTLPGLDKVQKGDFFWIVEVKVDPSVGQSYLRAEKVPEDAVNRFGGTFNIGTEYREYADMFNEAHSTNGP